MKHVPNLTKAAELVSRSSAVRSRPTCRWLTWSRRPIRQAASARSRIPGRADAVGIVSEEDIDRIVAETGMDGLEAHYRSYSDQQTALYRRLADERGMLVSAGSDSHAPHRPTNPRPWHAVWVKDLLARMGVDLAPLPEGEPDWIPGMDPLAIDSGSRIRRQRLPIPNRWKPRRRLPPSWESPDDPDASKPLSGGPLDTNAYLGVRRQYRSRS